VVTAYCPLDENEDVSGLRRKAGSADLGKFRTLICCCLRIQASKVGLARLARLARLAEGSASGQEIRPTICLLLVLGMGCQVRQLA
jgi:hypothetical protein